MSAAAAVQAEAVIAAQEAAPAPAPQPAAAVVSQPVTYMQAQAPVALLFLPPPLRRRPPLIVDAMSAAAAVQAEAVIAAQEAAPAPAPQPAAAVVSQPVTYMQAQAPVPMEPHFVGGSTAAPAMSYTYAPAPATYTGPAVFNISPERFAQIAAGVPLTQEEINAMISGVEAPAPAPLAAAPAVPVVGDAVGAVAASSAKAEKSSKKKKKSLKASKKKKAVAAEPLAEQLPPRGRAEATGRPLYLYSIFDMVASPRPDDGAAPRLARPALGSQSALAPP
eukprot:CAMPEP_0170249112 /NCGR_PEP_ID=MMETSP0116_2-20130129/24357_1 /TAXON_ID=400756 /ORGANISM="Durinskia baltica, Strain CSIRO CS-38" /LENGTH=277 /DNA_ID=CAMNT_0010500017 /DNA_START=93 /DNA_END=923 /DNA_ORIENTATION=+